MKTMKHTKFVLARLAALAVLLVLSGGLALAAHGDPGTPLWGYPAAAANAPIPLYDIGAHAFVASCVPAGGAVPPNVSGNGRGVAHDPSDGHLWYTVLNMGGFFLGDGLIHKTTAPPVCGPDLLTIPAPQTAIGALDIDPDDGHLWAAGYQPIGGFSFFYKVSVGPVPAAGTVLGFCKVGFGGGGVGNDTLALAKLGGLAGSGKYLLTDAGELLTSLMALDAAACLAAGGGVVAPVITYALPVGVTGIDYEPVPVGGVPTPKLIATDLFTIYDLGAPPFAAILSAMPTSGFPLEDITLKTAPVVIKVPFDIKPTSCPNPLNVGAQGLLPAAILGTATFDVTKVDVSTVKLAGVSPLMAALEDVATPFVPFTGKTSATDCTTAGPDGFLDLTLKFSNQAIVAAIGPVTDGQVLVLQLTGKLLPAFGGTPIMGEDVVVIIKK